MDSKRPIVAGIVQDWDTMTQLWDNIIDKMGGNVAYDERAILLTEAPNNPKSNRERTCEIFFENYSCKSFWLQSTSTAALYANGRTRGLVADVGHDKYSIVPIYEGYELPHAIQTVQMGGNVVASQLKSLLQTSNGGSYNLEHIRELMEQHAYCASSSEASLSSSTQTFELPDGNVVHTGSALTECTEGFFDVNDGIASVINDSTLKCDVDIRSIMLSNIVLAGAPTMLEGFRDRILSDLNNLGCQHSVKVIKADNPKFYPWVGGSILASLSNFEDMWISKAEYDESGPGIVHRKCL